MSIDFAHRRHFEDLTIGETIALGHKTITREMIIAFASEFDPLPFHLDEEAAKSSLLGGLAASGWHTAALTLRMLVDSFLGACDSRGGLGFRNLKWKKPVMVGDTISATATITALRRSASRSEWGILTMSLEVRDQHGLPVMTMTLSNLIGTRHAGGGR